MSTEPGMREVLRHLVQGWRGLVGLLSRFGSGLRMDDAELETLERTQAELSEVVRRQRAERQEGARGA